MLTGLNTIYMSIPGPTKHNLRTMFYTFQVALPVMRHGLHESLYRSLMRVLLYGYHYSLLHSQVGSREPLILYSVSLTEILDT